MSVCSLKINGDEILRTFVVQYTMLVFGNFTGFLLSYIFYFVCVFVVNIHFYMDPYVDSML